MPKITIQNVQKLIGFSQNSSSESSMVSVSYRELLSSDNPKFYKYIKEICGIFLNKNFFINAINQFLIVIHQDQSADIYVNDFPIQINIISKGRINAGQLIKNTDIADITHIYFKDIEIQSTDSVIFCFKIGWKFGLFYDFTYTTQKGELSITNLKEDLAVLYKYLSFEEEYKLLENEEFFNKVYSDGWFPFIRLLGTDFNKLLNIYSFDEIKTDHLNKFVNEFNKVKILSFIETWKEKEIIQSKWTIIESGIDSYFNNDQKGFIAAIKIFYSEIEGIIRLSFFDEKKKRPTFQELLNFVKDKAKKKFNSINSLGFPEEFYQYLLDFIFVEFDLTKREIKLSRHSTSHGVAKVEDYSKIKAFQAILTLDQLMFYM